MPPLAIAGIGAAASIGGALIAGSAQKKAANKAADISAQNNQQNIAFQKEMYDKNAAHFAPYEASGQTANNAIMQLLGLGGDSSSAASAFGTYQGSDGYQFRVGEGVNALQKAFGRNLDSGAAQKAAIKYGQGVGSDEFSRYMSLLDQQQRLGFGSAASLAGMGQNLANSVTAGNTAAADAAASARLYAGNANANMWSSIGSSFGQFAGQAFGGGGSRPAAPAFSGGVYGM